MNEEFYDEQAAEEVINAAARDNAKWQHRTTQTLFALGVLAVAVGLLAYFAIRSGTERQDTNHDLAVLAGRQAQLAGRQAEQASLLANASKAQSTRVVKFLQGDRGLPGVPGSAGGAGFPGPIGPEGGLGQTGLSGPVGIPGQVGLTGGQGTTGASGTNGAQGVQGVQGPTGDTGATGPTGPEPVSFTFSDGVLTYFCSDSDGDGAYTCTSSP